MASSVLLEALVIGLGLRVTFFAAIRHYLRRHLISDLQQVASSDAVISSDPDNSPDDSDSSASVRLRDLKLSTPTKSIADPIGGISSRSTSPSSARTTGQAVGAKGGRSKLYPTLAGGVFCLSFTESCVLFTLVVFGGAISERSLWINWNFALGLLLTLIVFIVPLGLCLLFTYRRKSLSSKVTIRTIIFTAVPFGAWLFAFYKLGQLLSDLLDVSAGSNAIGLYTVTLERICVPGVILIAALSGAGAVNTAWEAYYWRQTSQKEPVTDTAIQAAERALSRARGDLVLRQSELNSASAAEASPSSSTSMFGRLIKGDPASARKAALSQEVAGLVAMESQMVRDLRTMRERKIAQEQARTVTGKAMHVIAVAFSFYCVYRVVMSGVNLLVGHQARSGSASGEVTTRILDLVMDLLDLQVDTIAWSRIIGVVLVGSILIANMRYVLASVSRILRATSSGVGSSVMLLCLAQLMSVWLLTSLISLPMSNPLLESLPDFGVYTRVFDLAFLAAAVGWFVARWLERRIRVDDVPSFV